MNLREMIRSVLREEGTLPSKLVPSELSASQTVADRKAAFERLTVLRTEAVAIEGKQSEAIPDIHRIEQLELELAEVRQRVQRHQRQLYFEHLANSHAIECELRTLRSTYSSQIDAFLETMRDESTRIRSLRPMESFAFGERSPLRDSIQRYEFSTAPALGRRLVAVTAASRRAEELKVQDKSDAELQEEFAALKAALPSIDGCYDLRSA